MKNADRVIVSRFRSAADAQIAKRILDRASDALADTQTGNALPS